MRNFAFNTRRGFTLIELLVVMGILVLLAVLTGISVSQISKEARLSSGVNQVVAALGGARAYAIQNNVTVLLAFVVKVDETAISEGERVEMVLAESTGEMYPIFDDNYLFEERYSPVPGFSFAELPRGIKVAGPLSAVAYADDAPGEDGLWATQPGGEWQLEAGRIYTREPGRMIGVMFSSDGTLITRNVRGAGGSGSTVWPFIDFNRDGVANIVGVGNNYSGSYQYVVYDAVGDEVDLHPVQWLAVFDDEALREAKDPANWVPANGNDPSGGQVTAQDERRISDVTNWVESAGVPIFFNRYTGVAEVSRP